MNHASNSEAVCARVLNNPAAEAGEYRLFVALRVPEEVKAEVEKAQEESAALRAAGQGDVDAA